MVAAAWMPALTDGAIGARGSDQSDASKPTFCQQHQ